MKCYEHRESDAVGSCTTCGRGLCGSCAVEVGRMLSCRPCVPEAKVAATVPARIRTGDKGRAIGFIVGGLVFVVSSCRDREPSVILLGIGLLLCVVGFV